MPPPILQAKDPSTVSNTKKTQTEAVKMFNSNTINNHQQSNIYDKNELQAVCAVRQTVGSKDKDETLLERKL